jgi:hypothetical protein
MGRCFVGNAGRADWTQTNGLGDSRCMGRGWRGGAASGKRKASNGWVVTRTPGLTLRILTADCVPVFLIDPVRRAMGLVHAGWRGVHKGIVKKAVRRFSMDFQCRTENICVAFGPHIQNCCYDVGPDLAGFFQGNTGRCFHGDNRRRGGDSSSLSACDSRAASRRPASVGNGSPRPPVAPFCDRNLFFVSPRSHG